MQEKIIINGPRAGIPSWPDPSDYALAVPEQGVRASCARLQGLCIASPYVKAPDVLICLNEVSIGKFMDTMKPGSILVVNSSLCSPDYAFRDDIQVVRVPASDIANELGNPRGLNIAALGAAVAASGMFDCEDFKGYIDKFFARKGKVNPQNGMCFDAGVKSVTGTK